MKSIDLLTDLRPWHAGDTIHVEDDVAQRLVDAKEAENMRPFQPTADYRDEAPAQDGLYKTKVMRARR